MGKHCNEGEEVLFRVFLEREVGIEGRFLGFGIWLGGGWMR